ncbi:MAG: Omp28-related outer membrane protein [Bacteroidales bacterium]|nr:Omp28-related outer membrane protein [Bacteroidales bacterium]
MKHYFLLTLLIFGLLRSGAQTLVSTDVQPKNAVLEEFTGIHCVYCPEGHAIAASILENNPGRAVAIAIHQGSFAVPSGNEPDYRTPWGNAIANQAGVNSYPSATVNRHLFSGNVTNMSRGDWSSRCNEIMAQESPVNVGIESSYNESNRELTVHVELYYTSNAAQATNFINVALLQDHIFGPQTGGGAGNNYEHMHMLRDMITGQWGEEIVTTTAGSFVDKTYVYTVPESFTNIPCLVENCQVAVFVTETHQEVLSGDVVDAIGGTNQFIGDLSIEQNSEIQAGSNAEPTTYTILANSNLAGNEEFNLVLTSEDAPADWSVQMVINGVTYENQATIALPYHIDTPVEIIIIPGATVALANFKLAMSAVSVPQAPTKYLHIYNISGVENLVVNATGGPEAVDHQDIYLDGLTAAGSTTHGVTDAEIMLKGINAQAFNDIRNMFLNIAWTFPALTIPQMEAVKTFMNQGGNVLIAGQDIGWDYMSGDASGHGSPEATDFYENYLHANYVSDGNTSNNQFIAEVTDAVYGEVAQSAVVDVYGGNMYPEQITARAGALQSFYYNAAKTKCGAVRAETEVYKVVYFGVGLEMIQNAAVRNHIITASLEWFDIGVGLDEPSKKQSHISVFPNPNASGLIHFTGDAALKSVEIIDMTGKTILNQNVTNSDQLKIDGLHGGLYLVKMITNQGVYTNKLVVK